MVQLEAVAKASNKGRWSKEPDQKVRKVETTVSFFLSVILVSSQSLEPVLGTNLGIGLGDRPGKQPQNRAGKQTWETALEQGWERAVVMGL